MPKKQRFYNKSVISRKQKETLLNAKPSIQNIALDGAFDPETVSECDEFQLEEDARFRMDTITDSDGKLWLPLFFNVEALHKGQTANVIMPVPLLDVLQIGLGDDELMGVVVDPFDRPCTLKKELLERFLGDCEEWQKENEK